MPSSVVKRPIAKLPFPIDTFSFYNIFSKICQYNTKPYICTNYHTVNFIAIHRYHLNIMTVDGKAKNPYDIFCLINQTAVIDFNGNTRNK